MAHGDTYKKAHARLTECGFNPEMRAEEGGWLLGDLVWEMVVQAHNRAYFEGRDEGYADGEVAGREDVGEIIADAIAILEDCIPSHGDLDGIVIGVDDDGKDGPWYQGENAKALIGNDKDGPWYQGENAKALIGNDKKEG